MRLLERIAGPLTFGKMLESIRKCDALTQDEYARRLGVSKSHLCDVEKGRKAVSPARAARWSQQLGYPESVFVQLALQSELDASGLEYSVSLSARRAMKRTGRA